MEPEFYHDNKTNDYFYSVIRCTSVNLSFLVGNLLLVRQVCTISLWESQNCLNFFSSQCTCNLLNVERNWWWIGNRSVNLWLEKWRHCSLCEVLVLWMGLKGFGSNVLITWSPGMCKCNYITFLNISIAISLNVIGRLRAKLISNEKRPMLNINVTNWSDKCNRPEHFLFRSMSVACF